MTVISVEDFFKNANPKQLGLLEKLTETAKKENELCERINKDEEELKIIKTQMADYMTEAISLGMGNLGIIQRNYKNYVGEDIPTK
jgi:hypothetical protein